MRQLLSAAKVQTLSLILKLGTTCTAAVRYACPSFRSRLLRDVVLSSDP